MRLFTNSSRLAKWRFGYIQVSSNRKKTVLTLHFNGRQQMTKQFRQGRLAIASSKAKEVLSHTMPTQLHHIAFAQ